MRWIGSAAFAAVLLLSAPHAAQAQVSFGIGVSRYSAPAYGPGYGESYGYRESEREHWIARERREQWEAAQAAEWRHEQWERQRFLGHEQGTWQGPDHSWQRDRY